MITNQSQVRGFTIMRHALYFFVSLVIALGVAVGPAPAQAPKKPNILWIIGEDMGPHWGCYGTKEVSTPNLDKLAARGMRYTRFYTTAPVCSPSRSAFMTGMYQTSIGAHNHRSNRAGRLPDGVRLLTEWIGEAGYFTANVVAFPIKGLKGTGKTDWNFRPPAKAFDSSGWSDLKKRQPFFAQVNFSDSHRAFTAPKHADPAKVALPPYVPDHPIAREDMAKYLDEVTHFDLLVGRILALLEADGLADDTIVVIFGDNGECHVRGKQFCYEEGLRVPLVIHWPKNFPAPRHYQPGRVDERLLMAIDLAPTMLDIAGAKPPPKMQGQIFLGERAGAARQHVFGARDRCDMTVMRIRSVRDERYRYIRNFTPDTPFLAYNEYKIKQYPVWTLLPKLHAEGKLTPEQAFLCQPKMPKEELYDLTSDPHQVRNLAESKEHAQTLARLRGVLEQWIEETNDQGRIFESPDVVERESQPKKKKD
jgi:N-sulfoglucosamine sulfohydrolase